jgi:hypothetical protein
VSLALYFLVKFIAYGCWCTLGLRLLRDPLGWQVVEGFFCGLGRLIMGGAFGLIIWIASNWIDGLWATAHARHYLIYIIVFVPMRWIEWSIFSLVVSPRRLKSPFTFLVGENSTDRLWRFGGAAISCLADIPVIIYFHGLPIGSFGI